MATRLNALVVGGCGFIGSNLSDRLLSRGHQVTVYDNLSRPGSKDNLSWLGERHGASFEFARGDVRDRSSLSEHARGKDAIYYLAAQVAVTSSIANPREDFEINAQGTLNALEPARQAGSRPIVIFSSTNKVYGALDSVELEETSTRYRYRDGRSGISEDQPLDFHSPYGCSKGCADQYVRDYYRTYGLPTVVLRQSCVYGPRQFGDESQGWIAHFVISAALGRPITIYGNGKQVRDALFVDDLVSAMELATESIDRAQGQIFNVGGGAENSISLLELVDLLNRITGKPIPVTFGERRLGDQALYVSDTRKAERELAWRPKVSLSDGISRMYDWVQDNLDLLRRAD